MNNNTRNTDKITLFVLNITFSKILFFPSNVIEWNKLDPNLRSAASLNVSKKKLLKVIRPSLNSIFNCHNCRGIKYLTRLRLGLSNLRKDKCKRTFQNTLNPYYSCGLNVEIIYIFFLHCPFFTNQRCTILSTVNDIDSCLINTGDTTLTEILLLGKASLYITVNTLIRNATMNYIISTNKFEVNLFEYFVIFITFFHNFIPLPYTFLRLFIHISPSFFYIF